MGLYYCHNSQCDNYTKKGVLVYLKIKRCGFGSSYMSIVWREPTFCTEPAPASYIYNSMKKRNWATIDIYIILKIH